MDSLALGKYFLPCVEKMAARVPLLHCAVLCTPDGFNLCSVGLNEEQVGKMAALSSSLFSVGDAAVGNLSLEDTADPARPGTAGGAARGLDYLTLEARGLQIVSTKISRSGRDFILMAASRASLGVVLVGVKATVADIEKML